MPTACCCQKLGVCDQCQIDSDCRKCQKCTAEKTCISKCTYDQACDHSGTCKSSTPKVVCYFKNTGDGKYLVQNIKPSLCTHIIYAFSILDPTTHLMISSNEVFDVEQNNFKVFTDLKVNNPTVRFMLALGGATNSQISGEAISLGY